VGRRINRRPFHFSGAVAFAAAAPPPALEVAGSVLLAQNTDDHAAPIGAGRAPCRRPPGATGNRSLTLVAATVLRLADDKAGAATAVTASRRNPSTNR
jgi:hypothetical protein